jgi:hypothetical protein
MPPSGPLQLVQTLTIARARTAIFTEANKGNMEDTPEPEYSDIMYLQNDPLFFASALSSEWN